MPVIRCYGWEINPKEDAIKYIEAFLEMEPNASKAAQIKEILERLKK